VCGERSLDKTGDSMETIRNPFVGQPQNTSSITPLLGTAWIRRRTVGPKAKAKAFENKSPRSEDF